MVGFDTNFWEGHGFEEVKKLASKGSDALEHVMSILSDRADASKDYAKNLQKLSSKVESGGKDFIGTIRDAWSEMRSSFEQEAKWHLTASTRIHDEIVVHMKSFHKESKKARKPIETKVDKITAELFDARSTELKFKKSAFSKCKEMEGAYLQFEEARSSTTRPYSEKDLAKLEKAARKAEEATAKSDKEHRDSVRKLEQLRRKWEAVMAEGCLEMQVLEAQRVEHIREMLLKLHEIASTLPAEYAQFMEKLQGTLQAINPESDVSAAAEMKGTGPNRPREVLYECYEEDPKHSMKADRRGRRLEEKVHELEDDVRKEEKTLAGVRGLSDVYSNQPSFSDEKGKADVLNQVADAERALHSAQAVLYKLQCSLAEAQNQGKGDHPFAPYIERSRDTSTSFLVSTFALPSDSPVPVVPSVGNSKPRSSAMAAAQSTTSVASAGNDFADSTSYRAMYDYDASKEDELSIREGDTLELVQQYEGGWWLCRNSNGEEGLLPENYLSPA
ncbi:hypothetical protein CAOG_02017 [Capsaspora owczarzaki ATCC 30864]|uniref:SH3 domain-containing protein n=1 Tax=Capsaspora owczarzaki (strain ATCC 30864) TaxID=595528 RepID=A0A0D2VL01_CAPO3|nr:hypothetical protein CAOG_02017 [Capsaspora owczarzaki ATCC 30864]KJE90762.1 hypothetical protein CAOG_002017 [Capsaspora owczarzaki ATCC 30864]|eukprot:XP_004348767.1 hypothetical protein CAOG_02017 [Capsaspora owczarzaki ATCC 30864]